MFAPGDIVVCIDNQMAEKMLTLGQDYCVHGVRNSVSILQVISDDGVTRGFSVSRFAHGNQKMTGAEEYEDIMAAQEIMKDA